jgi:acyl-CoA thioesterase
VSHPAASPIPAPDPVLQMMASDSASAGLGITLVDHGPGWAITQMTVRPDMENGYGTAHGGLVFAVADTAFACACNSRGAVAVAAACEIVFVAPARGGDVLRADARERTRFGRSGIYDVTVRRGPDVIAEFRGRSHQMRGKP